MILLAQARLGVPAEEHQRYFGELLGDVTEPTLPFGLADARGDGSGVARSRLVVDADLAARVREMARGLGTSRGDGVASGVGAGAGGGGGA